MAVPLKSVRCPWNLKEPEGEDGFVCCVCVCVCVCVRARALTPLWGTAPGRIQNETDFRKVFPMYRPENQGLGSLVL